MRFTNTVSINRAPAEVFAYLADFEHLPRWNYAIDRTRKVTAGPVRVGSIYHQTRTTPVRSEEHFEVTEFEPEHRLTIRGTIASLPAQITYTLTPQGSVTVLSNTIDLQPTGPRALAAPLAGYGIKRAVAANLDVLKQLLERS